MMIDNTLMLEMDKSYSEQSADWLSLEPNLENFLSLKTPMENRASWKPLGTIKFPAYEPPASTAHLSNMRLHFGEIAKLANESDSAEERVNDLERHLKLFLRIYGDTAISAFAAAVSTLDERLFAEMVLALGRVPDLVAVAERRRLFLGQLRSKSLIVREAAEVALDTLDD